MPIRPSICILAVLLLVALALPTPTAGAAPKAQCRLDSQPWLGCPWELASLGTSCECPLAQGSGQFLPGHVLETGDEDVFPISSESIKLALGLTRLAGPVVAFVPKTLSANRRQDMTAQQQQLLQIYDYFAFHNLAPAPSKRLIPARAFLASKDIPPPDVAGYGVVALKAKPTAASKERLEMLCQSFLATLPSQQSLPADIPTTQRIITIWPLDQPQVAPAGEEGCKLLLDHYDLYAGHSAIQDAVSQGVNLSGRGPFLIGWAPSNSRYVPDAVVLVVDMSRFDTQENFDDALLYWLTKIVEDPDLWKSGFSVELLRLSARQFADKYGPAVLNALKFAGK